jgi:hypothetical protein
MSRGRAPRLQSLPSIQPKQSASSTASSMLTQGWSTCFLSSTSLISVRSAWCAASQPRQAWRSAAKKVSVGAMREPDERRS